MTVGRKENASRTRRGVKGDESKRSDYSPHGFLMLLDIRLPEERRRALEALFPPEQRDEESRLWGDSKFAYVVEFDGVALANIGWDKVAQTPIEFVTRFYTNIVPQMAQLAEEVGVALSRRTLFEISASPEIDVALNAVKNENELVRFVERPAAGTIQ